MKAIALQAIHQPTGGILGHEVLVRQSVGGTWVGPGAFMAGSTPQAWVSMDHAVAQMLFSHAADLRGRGVSFVNVSAHTLSDPAELNAVCRSLAKLTHMGVEVCVEVSETFDAVGRSFHQAMEVIKDQGLLLAIDDFGIECSNFSRLSSYPWQCQWYWPDIGKARVFKAVRWFAQAFERCFGARLRFVQAVHSSIQFFH